MTELDSVDARLVRAAAGALGTSRLAALLVILDSRMEWLGKALATPSGNVGACLELLHQSRGSAASLGLTGLHRLLSKIEHAFEPDTSQPMQQRTVALRRVELRLTLRATLRATWCATLDAAASHIPELRRHRPFSTNE